MSLSSVFLLSFAAAGMAELAGLVQRLEAAVGRLESMSASGGGPAAVGGEKPPCGVATSYLFHPNISKSLQFTNAAFLFFINGIVRS